MYNVNNYLQNWQVDKHDQWAKYHQVEEAW
jgi:hypothetical protein